VSAPPQTLEQRAGLRHPPLSRAWAIVGALSVTETVSWGILYYAFAVFLLPMREELGFSTAQLTGAFSLALLLSGVAGIAVGRYLDGRSPRALMTAGSIAGVLLVLAWSRAEGLAAFYALWAGIGLVMATVLYEPAFVVLAKWFPAAGQRRQALTALTLVAALASFIFLPLSQALIDAHGWRDALVILALILAAITVPIHALVLRQAPQARPEARAAPSTSASHALRSAPFWLISAAFFLATFTGIAMTVLAVPYLVERGYSAPFAAFAVGLIGFSQIPGRVLFATVGRRLPPEWAAAGVFALIAAGIALLVGVHGTVAAIAALVVLGMGNGMSTLSRATLIADRYGAGAYGTIGGVAAFFTTGARAGGPVAAAVYAEAVGYTTLLWTLAALALVAAALAFRAETL
jgi:Major Facilitator Superfamily